MQLIHNDGIYLASGSPRRAELLAQIGVSFDVISVDVDETVLTGESAQAYVTRLAIKKAKAGYDQLELQLNERIKPVLGADTAIYISETENTPAEILGKPQTFQDAYRMMTLLSGRTHQVFSAAALIGRQSEMREEKKTEGLTDELIQQHIVQISNVTMREISDQEIEAYWQTQEPQDKAGGYGIQGMAAIFISKLEGSYSGVMGLPLFETANLISNFCNEKNH